MRPFHGTAAYMLAAVLATASVGWAGPKDGDKSARDDDDGRDVKQKVDGRKAGEGKAVDGKGAGMAERIDALERQVKDLASLIKQRIAGDKGQPDKHAPDAKPGSQKGELKREANDKQSNDKQSNDKQSNDKQEKGPIDSKGDWGHGKGRVRLVKGPDGQLLVPLSALPPGLQKQFLADAQEEGHGKKNDAKGDEKRGEKKGGGTCDKCCDDDDHPKPKKNVSGDDENRHERARKNEK